MPSNPELVALTAAVSNGFAALTAAVTASQSGVDLAPLTAEVKRVADALYVENYSPDGADSATAGVAQVVADGNAHVASVIGQDTAGENRVRVNPELP